MWAPVVLPCIGGVPTAHTRNGSYAGVHNTQHDQDFFLGVPYAQPPVHDLRFRVPEPLNESWNGIRSATTYSPGCIGYGDDGLALDRTLMSEDCLYLNIVRPSGLQPHTRVPVAVWIHGGAYAEGASRDPRYNLSFIVGQSEAMGRPMVGVSLNYRLHGWGFLWGREMEEAGASNLGLRDQRLALTWLQENIAAFGGDPSQVTIWGESAGANSVGTHLVAYGGRDDGLFRAAIGESGAPTLYHPYQTVEDWQPYFDAIARAAQCHGNAGVLDCLRDVPTARLNTLFNGSLTQGAAFGPVIDGDFLVQSATTLLRKGAFVKVPFLHGANTDEGWTVAPKDVNTTDRFRSMVESWGLDAMTVQRLYELYLDPVGEPVVRRTETIFTDRNIHAPRRLANQIWSVNKIPSYGYHFDLGSAKWPSYHFCEIPFVMYNTIGLGYENIPGLPYTQDPMAEDRQRLSRLADLVSRMWISFVTTLDPNHFGDEPDVDWSAYRAEEPAVIMFDGNASVPAYMVPDTYRAEGIELFASLLDGPLGQ
ncbi:carboxylesterase family protein [Aspergillus campestris IBT 28561]|uniref:Carboxylic ester hydrolase n=1 Tax=Aspergillus campestris (strain IBT 28561) TaxID=1392248 RepID=A0A2I1CS06_ASPC2|nr:carboxylesterase family protein [Aspergillus campestris IBT 28561]PKY00414.1 carboxylesterase family protein [Aspergillus campestris IBT 28561]